MKKSSITRRDFLKVGGLAAGGLALRGWDNNYLFADFPNSENLVRVTEQYVNVRALPTVDSALVGTYNEDDVVPCLREVVGGRNTIPLPSQRWVETPLGYVWSPFLQPVKNQLNAPVQQLMESSLGPGMWVEVTVPWIDVLLVNSEPWSPALQYLAREGRPPRLYYSQIMWVDQIKTDENGQVWYRIREPYGSYGDVFWGKAESFRMITPEEISPISPEVENKHIEINLDRQTLSCFEDNREVFFCRVSTGIVGEDTETPPGLYYYVWRKLLSVHMAGGTTGVGYDLMGIGYTTLFMGEGIAIHSTFWHNRYGERTSHGCVNSRPQDAKWIWRWSTPIVSYDPGDRTVTDFSGTNIRIFEY